MAKSKSGSQALGRGLDALLGVGTRDAKAALDPTPAPLSERVRGVEQRLAEHGLTLPGSSLREVRFHVPEARQAFAELMQGTPRPTAVICGSDVLAIGAVLEAAASGLSVPGDVSVTGFDNLPLASELSPSITTVELPADEMGELVADALVVERTSPLATSGRELQARLVVRESTSSRRL